MYRKAGSHAVGTAEKRTWHDAFSPVTNALFLSRMPIESGRRYFRWDTGLVMARSEDDWDRAKRAITLLTFRSTSQALRACVVQYSKAAPWMPIPLESL
jgi:hypothetical protein